MLSLLSGEKKLAELKTDLNTRETTILHVLKEFETLDITSKKSGTYSLTSLGIIEASICKDTISAARVLEKFKEFWVFHDVKPIPQLLLTKIGELEDSTLVKTEANKLEKVHETFMQMLLSSKMIKGTSPIFHSDYVKAFEILLGQGASVQLILTVPVLKKTMETTIGETDLLQRYIESEKLKIYLNDDLKVALTITEKGFSLGLFAQDGNYDYGMDLLSVSDPAVKWGHRLFQSYLEQSRRLRTEDIT
jgi:predicted transcriptional regulator